MFTDKLRAAWAEKNSMLCVGLDPDLEKIPETVRALPNPIFEFNRRIIDATADLVCAFKPQIAFYAAQRAEDQLEMTMAYLRKSFPLVPTVLDAKRGDIGSTAEMYAREAFDRYGADAVTVNPYLGTDSIEPFLRHKDKGVIVLCRTSNPGAKDLQNLECHEKTLYQTIADRAVREWNGNRNVLLVVGATYPNELREIRAIVGDMPLLVPGIGTQGGDIAAVIENGVDSRGAGLMISASRSVLYASKGPDFADAARQVAMDLRNQINFQRNRRSN